MTIETQEDIKKALSDFSIKQADLNERKFAAINAMQHRIARFLREAMFGSNVPSDGGVIPQKYEPQYWPSDGVFGVGGDYSDIAEATITQSLQAAGVKVDAHHKLGDGRYLTVLVSPFQEGFFDRLATAVAIRRVEDKQQGLGTFGTQEKAVAVSRELEKVKAQLWAGYPAGRGI